jgi:hypothetical protein
MMPPLFFLGRHASEAERRLSPARAAGQQRPPLLQKYPDGHPGGTVKSAGTARRCGANHRKVAFNLVKLAAIFGKVS